MKILLVHDYATPRGGAELSLYGLRDGLRERGHEVQLFASSAGSDAGEQHADAYCFGTTSRFRTLVQTANPSAALHLRRLLEAFRPDVVHVRMFLTQLSPLILPLLREVPSLYEAAWYRPVCLLGTKMLPDGTACESPAGGACLHNRCVPLRDWLPLMLQMKLWRHWRPVFDRIVANSEATRRRLLADDIGPVDVVALGVPVRPARPSLSSPPTVAFAGRLVPEKGLDVLLAAFARVIREVPEARLVIAGDGPEREQALAFVARSGLSANVSLLGHLPRAETEQSLARAWVQVVPSRWEEPFGLVATEAMMRGTAVVASDAGGLREIVDHAQTGLLFPTGDVDALTEALRRLVGDRKLAEQMGSAGREIAITRFNEATYVDTFVGLYESLRRQR